MASEATTTSDFYTTLTDNGDFEAFSTTIVPDANYTVNTTIAAGNYTWIPQGVTQQTIVITSSYGYYYLYSFYCCMTLLFLISMITLAVRLSAMKNAARKNEIARRQRERTAANSCNAYYNHSMATSSSNASLPPPPACNSYDLPPKYDDLMNVLDTKMEIYDAENGAVGDMGTAISTATMETNVELGGSVGDLNENANSNQYPIV